MATGAIKGRHEMNSASPEGCKSKSLRNDAESSAETVAMKLGMLCLPIVLLLRILMKKMGN